MINNRISTGTRAGATTEAVGYLQTQGIAPSKLNLEKSYTKAQNGLRAIGKPTDWRYVQELYDVATRNNMSIDEVLKAIKRRKAQ